MIQILTNAAEIPLLAKLLDVPCSTANFYFPSSQISTPAKNTGSTKYPKSDPFLKNFFTQKKSAQFFQMIFENFQKRLKNKNFKNKKKIFFLLLPPQVTGQDQSTNKNIIIFFVNIVNRIFQAVSIFYAKNS